MFRVGSIYDGSRALLNDQDNTVFTNTVQAEYLKIALNALNLACQEYEIPFVLATTTTAIDVEAGITDIGGPDGPALPEGLVEVLQCWEIAADTSGDYMLMKNVQFLPKTDVQSAYLGVWQWANEYIHLLGATGDIQVKLDYIKANIGDSTDENTVIRLTNSIEYLKHLTAAYCARFIGENESRAELLSGLADDYLAQALNIKIKAQQNRTTRRRPFMGAYKSRFRG
jgi:hypothetical protein